MISIKLLEKLNFIQSYKDGKEIYMYKKNGADLETSPVEVNPINVHGDVDCLGFDSFYTDNKEELEEIISEIEYMNEPEYFSDEEE